MTDDGGVAELQELLKRGDDLTPEQHERKRKLLGQQSDADWGRFQQQRVSRKRTEAWHDLVPRLLILPVLGVLGYTVSEAYKHHLYVLVLLAFAALLCLGSFFILIWRWWDR